MGARRLFRLERLALFLVLAGCGAAEVDSGETTTGDEAPQAGGPTAPPPVAGSVQPADGVRTLGPACAESADDDCDARDDDCDGVIDEGCGLATGLVQVTAAWGSDADIDLYVQEPRGDTLSFQRGRSMVGGRVDRVGRGACDERGEPSRLESLVWESNAALRGSYHVSLHYWGECQSLAGPTDVTVSVAVAGQVVATVSYTLSPNELKEVLVFDVD